MKKNIKVFVIMVISILVSGIFTIVFGARSGTDGPQFSSKAQLHYNEFHGLSAPAEGELYYNHLCDTPSYLCAWHGGMFFYKKNIIINLKMNICGVSREEIYRPEIDANKQKRVRFDPSSEEKAELFFPMCRPQYAFEDVCVMTCINDILRGATFSMTSESYSGDAYIPTETRDWAFIDGDNGTEEVEAKVTTSGYTRFIPEETHYDKNNAMSFLLADCEYNTTIPAASFVNVAFWAHLNDPSTSSSNPHGGTNPNPNPLSTIGSGINTIGNNLSEVSEHIVDGLSASERFKAEIVTNDTLKKMKDYLKTLESGGSLTVQDCEKINGVITSQLNGDEAFKARTKLNEYKKIVKERQNPSRALVEDLKKTLKKLIGVVQTSIDPKIDENRQNTEDYGQMWKDIGDNYADKVQDRTRQDKVTVEYNATTQEYLIGPFTIEYIERYTSDYILAGMAGDTTLIVKEYGREVPIKKSTGEWKFTYLSPRIEDGIPGTGNGQDNYGYNEYPHTNEPFYITLKYKDGRNAVLGMEFYFRYMQSESLWTRSIGEIEELEWTANFSTPQCLKADWSNYKGGTCDGAGYEEFKKSHTESEEGGVMHYHYVAPPTDAANSYVLAMWEQYKKKLPDLSSGCNNYDTYYKTCKKKKEDCTVKKEGSDDHDDNECKHNHNGRCKECGDVEYYECKGHKCGPGRVDPSNACEHGFYAAHYAGIKMRISGKMINTIPIQYIGTCHWAWRLYFDVTIKVNWNVDLTTSLAGNVWLDIDAQKDEAHADVKDGQWEENSDEHGVENVLVTVKLYQNGIDKGTAIMHDASGKELSWPVRTDSKGYYHVDRIEAPGRAGGKDCYYVVEFEYDGQVYENTIFLENGGGDDTADQYTEAKGEGYFNKSMAVERSPDRKIFNDSFIEISGGSPMNSDYSTTGHSQGGPIEYKPSENKQKAVSDELSRDSSRDIRSSEFISAATEDHENMSDGWKNSYSRYKMTAYTHYIGDICGANVSDYQIYYPFDDDGKKYGSGDIRYTLNANNIGGMVCIDEYMLHINLGLKKRKETDISVLKDLYKMTIVVNEQEVVQNFSCLGDSPNSSSTVTIKNNDQYKTLKEVLEARRDSIGTNNLGLYKTDVAYSSSSRYKNAIGKVKDIKENTELRVFATYAIRVYNNSDTNDVTINELTDYYDTTYTLIDENQPVYNLRSDGVYASIVKEDMERTEKLVVDKPYYRILNTYDSYKDISWKPTKTENIAGNFRNDTLTWSDKGTTGGMKKSITTSLQGQRLGINEYAEIFTTYEIDSSGFDQIRNDSRESIPMNDAISSLRADLVGEKDNIAEVSKYSTYYSDKDVVGNFYRGYVVDQISGKIDKDSAPDNIVINDIKNKKFYEDDTCRAIPLNIKIENAQREMYGCVFEDKKTKDLGSYDLSVGDGIYDTSDDVLVPEVKVSMFEVVSLADCNSDEIKLNDLEYYYEVPIEFYNIDDGEVITTDTPNGKGGNYYINGFLPADYVLRFDYGTRSDATADLYSIDENGKINTDPDVDIIKYNGQDYENTSFLSGTKYTNTDESGTSHTYTAINDKFLNLRTEDMKTVNNEPGIKAVTQKDNTAYSVARDNEARRMVVNAFSRNIENDRGEMLRDRRADNSLYVEATQMFAETPIMQIEINQPKDLNKDTNLEHDKKVDVVKTIDGRTIKLMNQEYSIKNINFGLEERAKTDIRVEQYIESIYLMKEEDTIFSATFDEESGKVITDNAENRHLDKLTYLAHKEADDSNQQGFYAISVEDDYLNGLSMSIDYRIKIINESEVDFTGYLEKYNTPAKIIEAASCTPTTEVNTTYIKGLLKDTTDVGLATNATLVELFNLKELFNLAGRDPNTAILGDLLRSDIDNNTVEIRDTIRPDVIIYGKYLGRFYYENTLHDTETNKNDVYYIKHYKWADRSDIEVTYQMDKVVKTTVDQLIDYIDTNASYDLSTQNSANYAWDLSGNTKDTGTRKTIPTLDAIVSESSYRTIVDNEGVGKSNIYDRKGNALVTDVSSNIVIAKNNKLTKFKPETTVEGEGKPTLSGKDSTERADTYLTKNITSKWVKYKEKEVRTKDNDALTIGLQPANYDSTGNKLNSRVNMWITTAKKTASDTDANNMKFDNLVEVLVYSNPTGRRDVYSVPGNAMALATQGDVTTKKPPITEIGFWKAGYNSKEWWKNSPTSGLNSSMNDEEYKEIAAKNWVKYPEDDAYAPEFVTIIAPTGITLREYMRNVIIPLTILVILLIVMVGTFGVKQVKIHKRKDEF